MIDEKLKQKIMSSKHWRSDFVIVRAEYINGFPVVGVKSKNQDSETVLRIAKLNEVFQTKIKKQQG